MMMDKMKLHAKWLLNDIDTGLYFIVSLQIVNWQVHTAKELLTGLDFGMSITCNATTFVN